MYKATVTKSCIALIKLMSAKFCLSYYYDEHFKQDTLLNLFDIYFSVN